RLRLQRSVFRDRERSTARVALAARGRERQVRPLWHDDVERAIGLSNRALLGVERGSIHLSVAQVLVTVLRVRERLTEDRAKALVAGRIRVRDVGRGRVERFLLRDGAAQRDVDSAAHPRSLLADRRTQAVDRFGVELANARLAHFEDRADL